MSNPFLELFPINLHPQVVGVLTNRITTPPTSWPGSRAGRRPSATRRWPRGGTSTLPVHPPGGDSEDDGLAPPGPDLPGRLHVLRQVDVVPLPLVQALGQDRRQEAFHRAVEEHFGGLPLLQVQVHLDAVALVGPDQVAGLVEGEPPLVVGLDALDELVVGDGEAVRSAAASRSSTGTQPPGWRVRPSSWGACRRYFARYLLTVISRLSKVATSGRSRLGTYSDVASDTTVLLLYFFDLSSYCSSRGASRRRRGRWIRPSARRPS